MYLKKISYYNSGKKIINDITFSMINTRLLIIKGSNGSGKSTLLKILAGIYSPSSGEILRLSTFAYVPDSTNSYFVGISPNMFFSFLKLELKINSNYFEKNLEFLMKKLNLKEENLYRCINTLSLGEKKIVMLIAAFLINPEIYIMDEPFSGLDKDTVNNLIGLIEKKIEDNRKFIIASHEKVELLKDVDRTINLF